MAKPLLDDALWHHVRDVLPPPKPRRSRFPGRKPIDDRRALTGILFVLKMGIPWEDLPPELGCGSGMTCWRRLQHWHQAGVWDRVRAVLVSQGADSHRINWARAARDGRLRRLRAVLPWPRERLSAADQNGSGYRPAVAPPLEPVGPAAHRAEIGEAGLMETLFRGPQAGFAAAWAGHDGVEIRCGVSDPQGAQDAQNAEPALS